jgi:hypothetical protein
MLERMYLSAWNTLAYPKALEHKLVNLVKGKVQWPEDRGRFVEQKFI